MSLPATCPVSVRDLTKHYGPVAAVRGVSFAVGPGEVFGLLGPNGAGKTTTLECLLGLRRPDAGAVVLNGIDALAHPAAARARVGAQLQFAALPAKLTAAEALGLFASFYAAPAAPAALLARFGLTAKADARFDTLSGGQQRRLFLALAVVNQPAVIVLDEPTAGLDPQARRDLHALITGLKAGGGTVLLSTHDLAEAETLCDRVAILHEGRIIASAPPAEMLARSRARPRICFRTGRPLAPDRLAALSDGAVASPRGAGWEIATAHVNRTMGELVRALEADGQEMLGLEIRRPSLEDVFLELTGQPWAAAEPEIAP